MVRRSIAALNSNELLTKSICSFLKEAGMGDGHILVGWSGGHLSEKNNKGVDAFARIMVHYTIFLDRKWPYYYVLVNWVNLA